MTHVKTAKALPGDDLVPTPTAIDTRGINHRGPARGRLAMAGQDGIDRGGWYSYADGHARHERRAFHHRHARARGRRRDPNWAGQRLRGPCPRAGQGPHPLSRHKIVAKQAEAAAARATRPDIPAGLAASSAILRTAPADFAAAWTFVLEPLDGGRQLLERVRVQLAIADQRSGSLPRSWASACS